MVSAGWLGVRLAWQIASRASDPLHREFSNFKIDAIFAGVWIGLTGVNALPSCALLMMMGMNLMGAGGSRLFFAGTVLMTLATLLTLQLTGGVVSFSSTPLEGGLTLPIIILYPLLFAWVSYQTATTLAEHKRRLKIMSTHDGMTGVFNRRHWEMLLRAEFERCRRQHCDCTLLIIDIDHFKGINDTWGHDVGDEFAVIMHGTPAGNAIAAMSRVHEGLRALRLPCAPQVMVHISVGVAPLTPQFSHYREWLKSADLALYKAKHAGRNRTEVAA